MTRISHYALALALACLGLLTIFGAAAREPTKPEITTQGFLADTPQQGIIGKFPRLRVRIEAAQRIEKLIIKERSYEVDLASTRDKYNLSLFGLEQTPRTYTDVTLNLQQYINERIETEGDYEFRLVVVDRNDNSLESKIYLQAQLKAPQKESSTTRDLGLLETGSFMFQRTGTGPVDGAQAFGIDWQNIDNSNVSIRLAQSDTDNSSIVALGEADFENLRSIEQLLHKIASLEKSKAIVLPTANNGAVGEVFAVMHNETHYIFKITSSSAYPSDQGTKVTLDGDFKSGVEND
jgi:hypothetical protein